MNRKQSICTLIASTKLHEVKYRVNEGSTQSVMRLRIKRSRSRPFFVGRFVSTISTIGERGVRESGKREEGKEYYVKVEN
jgi:hypothetical protein